MFSSPKDNHESGPPADTVELGLGSQQISRGVPGVQHSASHVKKKYTAPNPAPVYSSEYQNIMLTIENYKSDVRVFLPFSRQ